MLLQQGLEGVAHLQLRLPLLLLQRRLGRCLLLLGSQGARGSPCRISARSNLLLLLLLLRLRCLL
jgi:hypothetical protein